MTGPPRRWKSVEELDVGEHIARLTAQRTGEPEPQFETAEYIAFRRQVLEDAGLEPDAHDGGERQLEEMTAADFDAELRGNR